MIISLLLTLWKDIYIRRPRPQLILVFAVKKKGYKIDHFLLNFRYIAAQGNAVNLL
jgi:hypothetical protein